MRAIHVLAAVMVVAGLGGLAWASSELQEGVIGAARHWWSAAPLLAVALGAGLALVVWAAPRLGHRRAGR